VILSGTILRNLAPTRINLFSGIGLVCLSWGITLTITHLNNYFLAYISRSLDTRLSVSKQSILVVWVTNNIADNDNADEFKILVDFLFDLIVLHISRILCECLKSHFVRLSLPGNPFSFQIKYVGTK
jgi:hypothetical protein